MNDAVTSLAGETIALLPERALHWPARQALLVADLHWGKAAALRAQSLPLPGGSTTADLARLDRALQRTGAAELLILGDLFHAKDGKARATLAALAAWRARHPALRITLVRGNHDLHAGDPPPELGITCVDAPMRDGPFALQHHPEPDPAGAYVLAGHLHPVATLHGRGRDRVRLPCFHFGRRLGILPAFSSLAAGGVLDPDDVEAAEAVWVIAEDEVLPLPRKAGS